MMFGFACRETANFMPLPLELSHLLLLELAAIRKEGKQMKYLRPDAKSQVTIEYDENKKPLRVHTIVVSTQHDEFVKPQKDTPKAHSEAEKKMQDKIKEDIERILIPRVIKKVDPGVRKLFIDDYILHVNPTGKFVIGGPHGDTGLTGRKIIVDTYGGRGAHGGGAFSGKDSSKVDRSAAYAARHIAKNMVAAGIADEVLVQVAYAIGLAQPVGLYVNTYVTARVNLNDGEIAERISKLFDMRPNAIVKRLGLKNPIFAETASYGHMGREPFVREIIVKHGANGAGVERKIKAQFFAWEKLDMVPTLKKAFKIR